MLTSKARVVLMVLPFGALHAQSARKIRADSTQSFVAAEVSYVDFRGSIDPWRLASLSFGHHSPVGTLIGRLNYANRFATSGTQLEGDSYPRLNSTTYAYLNLGYSDAKIFPSWRYGAEIFKSLPYAWEASLGVRELRFPDNPVTLFTGTVGKYFDNYWVSARPFVRFKSSGNEAAVGITARRYFADADHFVGLRASYGNAPSDQITPDQLARTRSYSADVHGSGGPWARGVGTWAVGFAHEELAARSIRRSWTATLGMKIGL
jgi:YaiO family outer membrane protein